MIAAASTPSDFYFVALEPDAAFAARIRELKQRVEHIAGPQLYLSDPPHLTLYLAAFDAPEVPARALCDTINALTPPQTQCAGWHLFANDTLTGNNTLVCALAAADLTAFASIQSHVVTALRPHCNLSATRARYAIVWDRLDPALQTNIMHDGFPFTGPIWRPHVTIASIAPSAWQPVWTALEHTAPIGPVHFPEIVLYRLGGPGGLEPIELERHSLKAAA